MIIFHCFAELPARDPKSRDGWVNRANYDTEEVLAQAARGERNFSTDCRRVLQSLSGLKYDPKTGIAHGVKGPMECTLHNLPQLHERVREALALVMVLEENGSWQAFEMKKALFDPVVLRTLQALPLQIRIAVTFREYDTIAGIVDKDCHRDAEYVTVYSCEEEEYDNVDDPGVFECDVETEASRARYKTRLSRFQFTVEANGKVYRACQKLKKGNGFFPKLRLPHSDELCEDGAIKVPGLNCYDMKFHWKSDPAALRDKLLARRDALHIPREPVQEMPLPGMEDLGVPVLGRLTFEPLTGDRLCTALRIDHSRRSSYDLISTMSSTVSADIKRIAKKELHRAQYAKSSSVILVLREYIPTMYDYSNLDQALYCITVTPDSVRVSDHRAALEDFAAAIDTLLLKNSPKNLEK